MIKISPYSGEICFMRNAFKVFFNSARRLSFGKIVRLLRLTLPHPLFSVLSFYATLKTYSIAKKYFPKTNSNDGIGNAFRHALWTALAMMYCCKISSPQKSYVFCKSFTDMHEELFPNEPIQTKMDLHNNQVGLNIFMEMLPGIHRQFFETGFLIDKILEKTKTAVILQSVDDNPGNELVYLTI